MNKDSVFTVYVPAFTGIHCAYSQRDGQAEFTWVAGHIPRWFTCLPACQVRTGPGVG